jgi:hypothetical protein
MYNFKIHTTMIQALSISSTTIVRASVIAQRTHNDEIGIIKAMMIDQLKEKLANGVAHFIYTKRPNKYGEVELREAWGTTNPSLAQKHINGNGVSRELFKTTAYFDIEKGGWRSFRWESIVKVF